MYYHCYDERKNNSNEQLKCNCNKGKPYVFVSYSHRDSKEVHEIIKELYSAGYNVWFDEGIDPGTEWDEYIASSVKESSFYIAFLSKNYLESSNCKDELNFARDCDIERLLVYLEDIELPAGMQMRLGRLQHIHKSNYIQQNDFYEKVFSTSGLEKTKIKTENTKHKIDAVKKSDVITISFRKMIDKYGTEVPLKIRSRFDSERILLKDKDALIYLEILGKVREYANQSGYATYIRGDIASSFIAYILGATDVNPLEPHYYCPKCHKVEFTTDVYDAWGLPAKQCECGSDLVRDGHNINFELSRIAFGDKAAYDISVSEQGFDAVVNKIRTELEQCFVCEKIHFGEVKSRRFFISMDEPFTDNTKSELELGMKFNSLTVVTNSLLTILHNMGKNKIDESLVFCCDIKNVSFDDIGIFNSLDFQEIKKVSPPTQLSDLLKIAGLTMGTDAWNEMVESSLKSGIKLSDTIAFRDDIYNLVKYALSKEGIQDTGISHLITQRTTRGLYSRKEDLFSSDKQMLKSLEMSEFTINSIRKIKYLMSKAHVIPLVKISILVAEVKNKYPKEFDIAYKLSSNTVNKL